jgi:hypothetical protein
LYAALALVIAVVCAAASLRRLWFAAAPRELDAEEITKFLGTRSMDAERAASRLATVKRAVQSLPEGAWERGLVEAMEEMRGEARAALVNENLREADWSLQKWARVPRVCASISTSSGLLLATFVLRAGLKDPNALSGDVRELVMHGLVGDALSVATIGIASTLVCVGAMVQANRIAKARLAATDKLVERLEQLVPGGPAPPEAGTDVGKSTPT